MEVENDSGKRWISYFINYSKIIEEEKNSEKFDWPECIIILHKNMPARGCIEWKSFFKLNILKLITFHFH